MLYAILSLHIFLCVVLIVLVLLQQGKGASTGALFGGSSNTLFGAAGANTMLTKITTGLAVGFMCTSVILVRLNSGASPVRNPLQGSVMADQPQAVEVPAADAANSVPADAAKVNSPSDTKSVPAVSEAAPAAPNAAVPAAPVANAPVTAPAPAPGSDE